MYQRVLFKANQTLHNSMNMNNKTVILSNLLYATCIVYNLCNHMFSRDKSDTTHSLQGKNNIKQKEY